ncbi:hypothetical protein SUGI_0073450 [Cryptomeria japonica]|nr:hypothetical protein SUGI_0073450 [Cryptomeria japonica]
MNNSCGKLCIVAVPFPALDHTIPLLDFSKILASHGLTISCVTTTANLPRLQYQLAQAISSGLDIRLPVLPMPTVEDLAVGIDSFEQLPIEQCGLIVELVIKFEHSFNIWLEDHQVGMEVLVCVMHDMLLGWNMETFLSEEQSKALVCGVEASGQPFIWAIKVSPKMEPRSSDTSLDLPRTYLPKGFHEHMKNRGLVIWGWAPQILILSHPSVDAFMSHYRWNSMVENVSLRVLLITWPMYAYQHFNSKLAVKLGIRIQVCEHRDGIPNKQKWRRV